MRVLGVDPGTAVLGYGLVEAGRGPARLLECGVLRTSPRRTLASRLAEIHGAITELITRHRPDVLSVESVFYARNARTTVSLAHARGIILLCAEQAGVAIAEYPPAVVKKTVVGRGAALKPQVGYMVARLLHLERPPTPADAADGVALALTHILRQGPAGLRRVAATAR